jgi:hypothetical protein
MKDPPWGHLLAGGVVAVVIGVVLSSSSGSPFWLLAALASIALNVGLVGVARRRARTSSIPPKTGRILAAPPPMLAGSPSRWVGGANVPGSLGRMNATWPLAVLEIGRSSITLRIRPPFTTLFGAESLAATPADITEMFPSKGGLGGSGVGIRLRNESNSFFWTSRREEVLQAASQAGFHVSWEERRSRMY